MEISSDVLSITGVLINAKAKYGDLSKIIHKGFGNEEKISYILESMRSFLNSGKYMEDALPKKEFRNYFEELSLLLIVNTEYSKPFTLEEYAHLTYNIPKISKYLLCRLIASLNMTEYFCSTVEKMPLIYSCELFSEFIPSLEKVEFQQLVRDLYIILNSIATILFKNQDLKHSDEMDKLLIPVPEFFYRFSRVSADQLPKLKKKVIYEQAGYVLRGLFALLLFCHKNNILFGFYMDRLIEATINVLHCISLDMFIDWAEIDLDCGQTLQSEIAENAYMIIEQYQQFKPASEVVQLLKPFASKPKDIKEQIRMADLSKIVSMVNRADENQRQWFGALVFSPFFSDEKAVECVLKWSHLCLEEDISRILNLSLKVQHKEAKRLAIKCSYHLNLAQLIVVVTRHFYNNRFVVLNNDVLPEIVLLFNKLKDAEAMKENAIFELLLLILQNPDVSINFVLTECLKNTFYISVIKDCFSTLKDVLKIHDIGLNCLQKAVKTSPPSEENFDGYVKLLQLFLDVDLLTNETLISRIINPSIADFLDSMEELQQILKIVNILNTSIQVKEATLPFFENLFKILRMRTQFMNHRTSAQVVVRQAVILIDNKVHRNQGGPPTENLGEDKFLLYYKKSICDLESNVTLLQNLIDDFSVENHTKAVCQLMQILPSCVTEEWISICSEIVLKSCCKDFLGIIDDMMHLLCQFCHNQENSDNYPTLIEALKYCIQQLGIVIQNTVLSSGNYIEDEIIVTELLVKLLSYLPSIIKESEGLNLLNLMTERSLKNLGQDKKFVSEICKIKNTKICQIIAQKILG